jgi:cardiolipin synthase
MTVVMAIPVVRFTCRVGIDKGRAWSVADELLLWAVANEPRTVARLSSESALPQRIVVASLARLMRFRLVEVAVADGKAMFRASAVGSSIIRTGQAIPHFSTRHSKRLSFVLEQVAGGVLSSRSVLIYSAQKLERERNLGADVRIVKVEGAPPVSHETTFARLEELAARGWEERLASIEARTIFMRKGDFMIVRVTDGLTRGMPRGASEALKGVVEEVASAPSGIREVSVAYRGAEEAGASIGQVVPCDLEPSDIVIGGPSHRAALVDLLAKAHRRLVLHSTFLDAQKFKELFEPIRAACSRGVKIDLLWGAERDEETKRKNHAAAVEVMNLVRQHSDTRGSVCVGQESTGSHSKLLLLDTADGRWMAAVGSCNWLSSPFGSIELSVLLREPRAVAQVAKAIQLLTGRRGLSGEIATEMAILHRQLCAYTPGGGNATMAVLAGEAHERAMRDASSDANRLLVVGSNRLGATARSGALLPGEFAAQRPGVSVVVLYGRPSGPLQKSDARALATETAQNGVRLVQTRGVRLHGKFVAWDDDDLIVTSLNWASASADPEFAEAELGVHLKAPGVARYALNRLAALIPELAEAIDFVPSGA